MKNGYFLLAVIIFFQQSLISVSFGQTNKTTQVSQTKKDTTLRHYHLRLNDNSVRDSYNSLIDSRNSMRTIVDGLNCAKLVSSGLSKINLLLTEEDSLTFEEKTWLVNQNFILGIKNVEKYCLSAEEANQIIKDNMTTIQKIDLFIKNPNDIKAFSVWDESFGNTVLLFNEFIKK